MKRERKRPDRARRSQIIRALSDLSRDGWNGVRPEDYQPLEAELRAIEERTALK